MHVLALGSLHITSAEHFLIDFPAYNRHEGRGGDKLESPRGYEF